MGAVCALGVTRALLGQEERAALLPVCGSEEKGEDLTLGAALELVQAHHK